MKIRLQDVCWIMSTSKRIRLIGVDLSRQKELDDNSANRICWTIKKILMV